jgi:hypothetical protein
MKRPTPNGPAYDFQGRRVRRRHEAVRRDMPLPDRLPCSECEAEEVKRLVWELAAPIWIFEVWAIAEFDYHAAADLFPTRRRLSRRQPLGTSDLLMPPRPSVSRWRTRGRTSFLARFLKSMSTDTVATYSPLVRECQLSLDPTPRTVMTDKTIELDQHRGMAAQKATDLRRLLSEVEANEAALHLRLEELESHLLAAPAERWQDVAKKAICLLKLFATTLAAQDPRRQKLIAAVLADFKRLLGES